MTDRFFEPEDAEPFDDTDEREKTPLLGHKDTYTDKDGGALKKWGLG